MKIKSKGLHHIFLTSEAGFPLPLIFPKWVEEIIIWQNDCILKRGEVSLLVRNTQGSRWVFFNFLECCYPKLTLWGWLFAFLLSCVLLCILNWCLSDPSSFPQQRKLLVTWWIHENLCLWRWIRIESLLLHLQFLWLAGSNILLFPWVPTKFNLSVPLK